LSSDAKKDKAEPEVTHYISGAGGMFPTVFDVPQVNTEERIHQVGKPLELMEQILSFVSKDKELVLDQFCGSGVAGEAALNRNRNSILIEKNEDIYRKACERIKKGRL